MNPKTVRIRGLVRLANAVREELAGPVSPERVAALAERVRQTLEWVEELLQAEGVGLEAVPPPSRKAHEYLGSLDFDAVETVAAGEEPERRPASVSLRGLRAHLDRVLDDLAGQPDDVAFERLWQAIRESSADIERFVETNGIRPEELKPETRACRGWLAYFAERAHLEDYRRAVARATPLFRQALERSGRAPGEVRVHFRPQKALCRVRRGRGGTWVKMPAPYICFGREALRALAERTLGLCQDLDRARPQVTGEAVRQMAARLEWLGGAVERAAGVYHDLGEAFERVNAAYFQGEVSRPRLTWSRTFTFRKFGHYDSLRDTVMVSSTLDRAGVPAFVVDFIVYHELLHKTLGAGGSGQGVRGHPLAFRRAEQQFRQCRQAQAILSRLSRTD